MQKIRILLGIIVCVFTQHLYSQVVIGGGGVSIMSGAGTTPNSITGLASRTGDGPYFTYNVSDAKYYFYDNGQPALSKWQELKLAKLSLITVNTATNLDTIKAHLANLVTLSGMATNSTHLSTFTGVTIPDNVTIKVALQSLETGLENRLSNVLTSGKILVGNGSNVATAVTMTGDGSLSNTGVLTVTKQNRIQYMDEGSSLGTTGTVDTLDFAGVGVVATRTGGRVNVSISGGVSLSTETSSSGSNYTRVSYKVLTGSPTITVTRTDVNGTNPITEINATGGTVRVVQIDDVYYNGNGAAVNYNLKIFGVPASMYDAVPQISKVLWNNTAAQATPNSSAQYDIDNTPGIMPYGYDSLTRYIAFSITNIPSANRFYVKYSWLDKDD